MKNFASWCFSFIASFMNGNENYRVSYAGFNYDRIIPFSSSYFLKIENRHFVRGIIFFCY